MQEINSLEVQNFLDYFEENIEVSFELSESKQSELYSIAKAKGIIAEGSRDLALFSGILEILDKPNGNKKILPKEEALKKLPQLCGKPLNLNHLRTMIVGAIIDYRYIEKDNQVIIYGCVYKSIFPKEYTRMKEAFKNKKLALSSEIWSPRSGRKYLSDGTFELSNIEFAGAAIIIMDKNNQPAEPQDKILELSMKEYELSRDLIFSNLNKDTIPSYHCDDCTCGGDCGIGCHNMIFSSLEQPTPTNQPNKLKIICGQCSHNFEYLFVPNQTSSIKCPQCQSILDQNGKMLYPPQIRNFDLSCPNDSSRNWLILENSDDNAKVRCQSCGKEYDITFKKMPQDLSVMLSKINFLSMGTRPCWACGTYNSYSVPSGQKKINLHCSKCGLDYFFSMSNEIKKDISKIEESIKKDKTKEELEVIELEKSKQEIEKLNKDLKSKDLEISTLKEGVVQSKLATKKLVRKAVSKIRDIKKKFGTPKTDDERAQNHFKISSEEWNKLPKEKKQEYVSKLPKRGSGLSKSILRKAGKKIRDGKKIVVEKEKEMNLAKSKLEKFVNGVKKFSKKIKEARVVSKAKDMEISTLKGELEKSKLTPKVEEPIKSTIEEPKLETASLKVGDVREDNLDEHGKRIKKIREQSNSYLNPVV